MLGLLMKTNMNNKSLTVFLVIVVIGLVGFMATRPELGEPKNDVISTKTDALLATVYKSPSCGCCGVYASYMQKEGYEVMIENSNDMSSVKHELGVPHELESCHTTEVGGYVVEGHMPNEAIEKLLSEKPDIKGIGMPGMPSGSPGMPGPKNEDFVIYEITHSGEKGGVFMTI